MPRMECLSTRECVLQGFPSDPESGIELKLSWAYDELVHGTTDEYTEGLHDNDSYRACPLMRVLPPPEENKRADCIVVGRARVTVTEVPGGGFKPTVTLSIDGVWTREDRRWKGKSVGWWVQISANRRRLIAALDRPGHRVPPADADAIATVIAKAIAEGSRNEMTRVREERYRLEAELTHVLRKDHTDDEYDEYHEYGEDGQGDGLESVLVNLIELRRAISRVREFSREAVRTILAAHGTSEGVFHAYRVFRDPTRVVATERRMTQWRMMRLSWIDDLDAGVRQCERLDEGLKDEVELISGLLSASATIESAREAEAQGTFNSLAAAVAVGFGLPALILALYGIESNPEPFQNHGVYLFIPVAVALALAGYLVRGMPRHAFSRTRLFVISALAFVILLGAAAVANWA